MAGHRSMSDSLSRLKLQVTLDDPFCSSGFKATSKHCKPQKSLDFSRIQDNEMLSTSLNDVTKEIAMHRHRSSIAKGLIEAREAKSVSLPKDLPDNIRELVASRPAKKAFQTTESPKGYAISESKVTAEQNKLSFATTAKIVMMQIRWKRKYRRKKEQEQERLKNKEELQRIRRKSKMAMAGIKD